MIPDVSLRHANADSANPSHSRSSPASASWSVIALIVGVLSLFSPAQSPHLTGRIASGAAFTLVALGNGTVMSCGNNANGALGVGNNTSSPALQPIPVTDLFGVTAVAAGEGHALALSGNNTVRSWGVNNHGQLGLGTTSPETTPQLISTLSNVKAVAAGSYFSLALRTSSTVLAWGKNQSGQIGNGTTLDQLVPQYVANLFGSIEAIAAGDSHCLALLSDGTVMAWGNGANGRLGLGNTLDQSTPQQIPPAFLGNVVAIAAGDSHSLALLADGTVMAWGSDSSYQLGTGTSANYALFPQPIPSATLSNVVAITAGKYHSLALLADGRVKGWGSGNYGQLGTGSGTFRPTPEFILGSNIAAVSTGPCSLSTFVVRDSGTVTACGQNSNGQLGFGTYSSPPYWATVPGLSMTSLTATAPFVVEIGSDLAWNVGCFFGSLPGRLYVFDASLTGSDPGTVLPGLGVIPLTYPLLNLHFGSVLGPMLTNFVGMLDAYGSATPALSIPHIPGLISTQLWGAAVVLDPTSPSPLQALTPTAVRSLVIASTAQVNSVTPSTASTNGGEALTITGNRFMPGATVTIGGQAATSVVVLDQWTITCTAPAHAPGTGSVVVDNPGAMEGTWNGLFTWLPPTITSITPNTGPTAGGTVVSITGTHFHPQAAVMFGLMTATSVTFHNSGLITCTAPPHLPGTIPTVWVSVTNPGGVSALAQSAFTYN